MGSVGIYFGSKMISIVESAGDKLINSSQIPLSAVSDGGLEDRASEVSRIVGLINSELRKNKVTAKEVALTVSGKDLIVRNFDLPGSLNYKDLVDNAVNFEAKKYIPFRTEELISEFQYKLDRTIQKNLILFAGIKKDVMARYAGIIQQMNVKASTLEYSAFSIFRLLKLSNIKTSGIIAIINIDFTEDDESNFVVYQNGFPLFSRDMTFAGDVGLLEDKGQETGGSEILDKVALEMRVSLDFYQRKFSDKKIEKVYLLSASEHQKELEAIIEEKGFSAKFVDVAKFTGKNLAHSSGIAKALSVSLANRIKSDVKINLFKIEKKSKGSTGNLDLATYFKSGLKLNPLVVLLSLAIIALPYGISMKKKSALEKELNDIRNSRGNVVGISGDSSYEDISSFHVNQKKKMSQLTDLVKNRMLMTDKLGAIAQFVPKDMWLTNISLKQQDEAFELSISGYVFSGDSEKEMVMVNTFYSDLKANSEITKYFKKLKIVSLDFVKIGEGKLTATAFEIKCKK